MARRRQPQKSGDWLFPNATTHDDEEHASLLDVVDNVLNRGAVLTGDVLLGVANVDLIYVKLSVLLAAVDKVTADDPVFRPVAAGPRRRRPRKPRRRGRRRH